MRRTLLLISLFTFILVSCKKDAEIIPDNNAPYYDGIPNVKVENYVNRLFIDLIGREALDVEMAAEVANLRASHLSVEAREQLITKLQTDLTWIQGDSSYKYAYYTRFYELSKVRMLEGATDGQVLFYQGLIGFGAIIDSTAGDSIPWSIKKEQMHKLDLVLEIKEDYMLDSIEIAEVYERLLDNDVYDQINMNSFNFIRASFNNCFFRYPTSAEFNASYDMVEKDRSNILFGKSGQGKGDYIKILVGNPEFYEGMIRWLYQTFLSRNPSAIEMYDMMNYFHNDHDVQKAQKNIMKTDEYANF